MLRAIKTQIKVADLRSKDLFGKDQKLANGRNVKVNEDYISESILNPQAKVAEGFQPIMPTFKGQVSEEQINHIVAYIKSLSSNPTATTSSPNTKTAATPAVTVKPAANTSVTNTAKPETQSNTKAVNK